MCVCTHARKEKGVSTWDFSAPLTHIIRMQNEYIKLKWK